MASSLQDQLLKAGLVTEEQHTAAEKRIDGRHKRSERARHGKQGPQGQPGERERKGPNKRRGRRGRGGSRERRAGVSPEVAKEGASDTPAVPAPVREEQQRRARLIAKDSRLRANTPEERARRERRAKVLAMLETERLNDDKAERPYSFLRGKRIKRIYVTDDQHAGLVDGSLVIIVLETDFHLVPSRIVDEVKALAPDAAVHRADRAGDDSGSEEDHPVPDDLVW